jgi:osmotically-inducible protein OsmY
MKKDEKIRKDVRTELEWGSRLNGSSVTIDVTDGIVTLSGHVDSYPKKLNATRIVERITNVKAVVNFLDVKLPIASYRRDSDIERSVLATIKWNTSIDDSRITCKVQNGVVILEGEVDWEFQRSKSGLLAGDITGVIDVKNLIRLSSYNPGLDIQKKINAMYYNRSQQLRPGF